MTTTKKYIQITRDDREFLCRAFGVPPRTVHNATHFSASRGNSTLAQRIRQAALQRGGILMVTIPQSKIPN